MLIYLSIIEAEEDKGRFQLLYHTYKRLMLYIAYEILHDQQDAEDAVHEAFLRLAEIIEKISDVDCPETRSLVGIITKGKAIDLYRKKQRQFGPLPLDKYNTVMPPQTEGVAQRDAVARAIAALPRRQRDILLLKYDQGFDNREIARMMDMTVENVRKTIQRTKAQLRKNLEEMGVEV